MVGVVEFTNAAGAVTVGDGATVSTTNVLVPLPGLPAASPWLTCTVYCALAVSADSDTDQVAPDTGTLLNVCSNVPPVPEPEKIFTVTVVLSALCVVSAACVP